MKRFIIIFFFLIPSLTFSQWNKQEVLYEAKEILDERGELYFKFTIQSFDELIILTKIISIDNVKGNEVYAFANKDEFEAFLKWEYEFTLLDISLLRGEVKMGVCTEGIYDWDTYPTYEQYDSMMNKFAADFPELCKIHSIGTSVEGREILFVKISDSITIEEMEPEFMFTSTMHGDETTGYVLMLRLINYLLTNYGSDSRVDRLVDSMEIWINPLANPDGTYAGGNSTVASATRNNANGVDLNRNFPDPDDGQHPDGNSWQPEAIAMMDFTDTMSFIMSANFHGGAEVVNYPWDTWSRLNTDNTWWIQISRRYADSAQANSPAGYLTDLNNGITNGFAWYPVEGGRQDFMNYYRRCRETTIEISETKLLSSSLLPDYWDYNKESFLGYMENCLTGIYGKVINKYGDPLYTSIKVVNYDNVIDNSSVYTDPDKGDFYRMLPAGTYDLVFSAEGYETDTIEDITISTDDRKYVEVILYKPREYILTGFVRDIDYDFPLENAKVHLISKESTPVATNMEGRYFLPGLTTGTHTLKITKPGYLEYITNIEVVPTDTLESFTLKRTSAISFEYGVIDSQFFHTGDAYWEIDSIYFLEGYLSISSGLISNDQTSSISVILNVAKDDYISFYKKVQSEPGFDYMNFYIDSVLQDQWSGFDNWSKDSFEVSPGIHTFTWEYAKDGNNSLGLDKAWLDFIELPPTQKDTVDISGAVSDAITGDSIQDANIQFFGDTSFIITSDMQGLYSIQNIPTDSYFVRVYADNYDTVNNTIGVNKEDTVFNFELKQLVNVQFNVFNSLTDSSISNSDIFLYGDYYYEETFDENGELLLTGFPQGIYNVVVVASGYNNYHTNITVSNVDTIYTFEILPITIFSFENPLKENIFSFDDEVNWYRDTMEVFDGSYSIRSGEIDAGSTSLILSNIELLANDSVSFYRKVSSEIVWDVLEFYINEVLIDTWSGELDWARVVYPVDAGDIRFKWVYSKDANRDEGLDAAWIDFVQVPSYIIKGIGIKNDTYQPVNILVLYPQPCSSILNVNLLLDDAQNVRISIIDQTGKRMRTGQSVYLGKGGQTIALPVEDMKTGFYILEIACNEAIIHKKFIKGN